MRIVARYSFKDGERAITERHWDLLCETEAVIQSIKASACQTKQSKEKTRNFRLLYDPKCLNAAFKKAFEERDWKSTKVYCEYSSAHYVEGYQPAGFKSQRPYREMDFVKGKLGVEVQFGKYAFMVYNVCAKMTIFRNLGHIDCGVEIVPVRDFAQSMSTGVAYFEQFAWDLETRGVGDIDIPVLVLGIDADTPGATPPDR